jgi:hypothetical protein
MRPAEVVGPSQRKLNGAWAKIFTGLTPSYRGSCRHQKLGFIAAHANYNRVSPRFYIRFPSVPLASRSQKYAITKE